MHEGVWLKDFFLTKLENLDNYSLIWLLYIPYAWIVPLWADGAFMGRSTPTTALNGAI